MDTGADIPQDVWDAAGAAMNSGHVRLAISRAIMTARPQRQPIETVPKDGRFVLLFGGKTNELELRDDEQAQQRPVTAFWDDEAGHGRGGWCFAYWDSSWFSEYDEPTEWMSL